MTARSIDQVLTDHADRLMSLVGVVATAQGLDGDQPCINVYVVEKTAELLRQIPDAIEGYPVVVRQAGQIQALDELDGHR